MKIQRNIIWNSELAYVVGLIVTDGCLSNSGRHISFTSKDIDLINTFRRILKIETKIGKTISKISWAYRVQVGDVRFYRWLLSIGLTPNKSKTLGAIQVPDEFFVDFLRGHLDGDGSITIYSDTYNTYKSPKYVYERLWIRFISASKDHIEWLKESIERNLNIDCRMHKTKPNPKTGNSIYVLKFGKKASIKLLQKIYYSKNLPSLERKRKQAEQFLHPTWTLPISVKSTIVRL